MKRAIVTLVILFRVSLAFAELPLSLTEALFEITGGKDYDQWLKLHGPVIFPQKFSCFQGGIFRSRFDKNPPFGLRYEIVMQHEFDHLDGHVFIEKISPFRRKMNFSKINNFLKGKARCSYKVKTVKKK